MIDKSSTHWDNKVSICGALRDLVPFVQFRKREKHQWSTLLLVKLQALLEEGLGWLQKRGLKHIDSENLCNLHRLNAYKSSQETVTRNVPLYAKLLKGSIYFSGNTCKFLLALFCKTIQKHREILKNSDLNLQKSRITLS